jgi:hypothetical protein
MDISNNNRQIQLFLSVIIFGYFGVKIVYGLFFKYYPNKYYYRNIDITTNEKIGSSQNTKNIALNAFIPGMWNNEMCDFITTIVLSSIALVFSYNTSSGIFGLDGTTHPAFISGYLIGLLYPMIYKNYASSLEEQAGTSCTIKYVYLACLFLLIVFITALNYTSKNVVEDKQKVTVYFVVLILLIFGLLLSKKNSKNYESVTYYNQIGGSCTSRSNKTIVQSSGDVINITPQFASFVLLFLFCYEPESITNKFLYIFIYGILLGILVSGISYYGIEYFLVKMPEKEVSIEESFDQKIISTPSGVEVDYDNANKNSYVQDAKIGVVNTEETSTSFIAIFKRILIAIIIAIFIFIIYSKLVKKI